MAESNFTRVCTCCIVEFAADLEHFTPHKMGKHGLHPMCRSCKKKKDSELRNRPDQQARQKAWRDSNKQKIAEYNADYRRAGYTSTEHVRAWTDANIEHARKMNREKVTRWRETLPWYRLKARISARLRSMLMGAGSKACRSTESILGYTMPELVTHIEKQFAKGMTWDRFMAGEIHIDHIIPVASFKPGSADSPEFKACWAMSNLRPMWAKENIAKGAKVLTLL